MKIFSLTSFSLIKKTTFYLLVNIQVLINTSIDTGISLLVKIYGTFFIGALGGCLFSSPIEPALNCNQERHIHYTHNQPIGLVTGATGKKNFPVCQSVHTLVGIQHWYFYREFIRALWKYKVKTKKKSSNSHTFKGCVNYFKGP